MNKIKTHTDNDYFKLYDFVASFYNYILLHTVEGEKALSYLLSRGFTIELITKLNLGYSHKGNMLQNLLERKGIDLKIALKYGLLKEFDKKPILRDFFYGRVMIPIRNEFGQTVGFAGRVLPHNTHPAKYMNTPETEHFRKGEIIFNLDLAKKAIKKKNAAIVFEGYFDTATALQHSLEHSISLMGTALTVDQVIKLKQLTNRLIICLDGDKAGYENTKRNCELLLAYGFEIRIALIPLGTDPHEYINEHGIDSFIKELIKKAIPYHLFLKEFMKLDKDLNDEIDALKYANSVLGNLNVLASHEQREVFKELAAELEISTDNFMQHIRAGLNQNDNTKGN